MRYIYLLLFLFACAEDSELQKQDCDLMIISDSLPFKFWQDGKSFNTRQICGVNPQCYCAPWICDREIRLQVKETNSPSSLDDVTLEIYDDTEALLKTITFDKNENPITDSYNTSEIGAFSEEQDGSSYSWSGAYSTVITGGGGGIVFSYIKYVPLSTNTLVRVTVNYEHEILSGSVNGGTTLGVALYDENFDIIDSHDIDTGVGTTSGNPTFDLEPNGQQVYYLGFRHYVNSSFSATSRTLLDAITVVTNLYPESIVYDLSFTPSEISPDICNKKVYFKIVGDTEEYLTDCVDIRDSFPEKCLKEVIYSNSKNFDNISYEDVSPAPQFRKIVEAQFWKEDNPQEQEDSVLSNGVIVTRRSEIQEKTLFETGFLPNHEHKNLQKIFMHNYVVIEDVTGEEIQWKKRDAYETENLNRYPLKRAQVWLTKYNSVEKNTI